MSPVPSCLEDRYARSESRWPTRTSQPWRRGLLLLVALLAFPFCRAAAAELSDSEHVRIIRGYFAGWERKDWDEVVRHLAPEFTFSSPAPDDHLSIEQFKAKCWNQAGHIARFEFPKIVGDDREALAIVHVVTRDGRVIRNVELFTFRDGRIASIEVFFGGGGQGFPTNAK
jgi:ketosteroid isomerase-like protein